MSRGVLRGFSGSCWPRPPLFTLLQASTSNSQKGEQLQESGACGHACSAGRRACSGSWTRVLETKEGLTGYPVLGPSVAHLLPC